MSDSEFLTPRERAALAQNPEASLSSSPLSDDQIENAEPHGVGGTLALLVAILIAISPAASAVMLFVQHQDLANAHSELASISEWRFIQIFDWLTWLLSSFLSAVAGYILWKRFQRSTIWWSILLIWFSSVGITALSFLLAEAFFPFNVTSAEIGGAIARPFVFSIIWTIYLLVSKRVKRTYV